MAKETYVHVDLQELLKIQDQMNIYIRELIGQHEKLQNTYVQLQRNGWDDDNQTAFYQVLDEVKIKTNLIIEKYMKLNTEVDTKKEIINTYFSGMEHWKDTRRHVELVTDKVATRYQILENQHKKLISEILGETTDFIDEAKEEEAHSEKQRSRVAGNTKTQRSSVGKKLYNWLMK